MSEVLYVRVIPGTPVPLLGQFANLSSMKDMEKALVFANGLNKDYVNDNTLEVPYMISYCDDEITHDVEVKARILTGELEVNFDMAEVVSLSGSANLDYGDKSKDEKLTRVFNMQTATKKAVLELQNIDNEDKGKNLAGVDFEGFTHVVTEVVYGKSAAGYIEMTTTDKGKHLNAGGELKVKLVSVPIGGTGKIEYNQTEDEKEFSVKANLKCIGSNAGGSISSMQGFADALNTHIKEDGVNAGTISYVLTRIDTVTKLKADKIKDTIDSSLKKELRICLLEIMILEKVFNGSNVPPEVTDGEEKKEYSRARMAAVREVRDCKLKAAKLKTNDDIKKFLDETDFMTMGNWQYAPDDSVLGKFAALVEKALEKKETAQRDIPPKGRMTFILDFNSFEPRLTSMEARKSVCHVPLTCTFLIIEDAKGEGAMEGLLEWLEKKEANSLTCLYCSDCKVGDDEKGRAAGSRLAAALASHHAESMEILAIVHTDWIDSENVSDWASALKAMPNLKRLGFIRTGLSKEEKDILRNATHAEDVHFS